MTYSLHTRIIIVAALTFFPSMVFAHTGVGTGGWVHGLFHPFLGIDHLLVMLAVGVWAIQMGGRAMWVLPTTFVGVLALGGALGMATTDLAYVESGILISLLVLGALIAAATRLSLLPSMLIVGTVALFHGIAHGNEIPQASSGMSYALGFMLASSLLHFTGAGLAFGLSQANRAHWLRYIGTSIAVFGGTLYFAG